MKYIMFGIYDEKTNELLRRVPIIFPSTLVHQEVAKALSKISGCSTRVVSAGDVIVRVRNCSGESETLSIKSKQGDDKIINRFDYLFGIDRDIPKNIDDILTKVFENEIFDGDKK